MTVLMGRRSGDTEERKLTRRNFFKHAGGAVAGATVAAMCLDDYLNNTRMLDPVGGSVS